MIELDPCRPANGYKEMTSGSAFCSAFYEVLGHTRKTKRKVANRFVISSPVLPQKDFEKRNWVHSQIIVNRLREINDPARAVWAISSINTRPSLRTSLVAAQPTLPQL
jgi:hypothetical protein